MSFVIMIVVAILIFGAVIFIHELGHFAVAKWSGIKVNEFAIGMGPALFKIKRGETTYALRLFPIGGFVSMEGEDEESSHERSFEKAPIYKRVLVIIAGAFMNIVLGFVATLVLVSTTQNDLLATRTILRFDEGATSQASGLQEGDTILKVNGRNCFVIDDIFYEVVRSPEGIMDLTVERDGEQVELKDVQFATEDIEDGGETYTVLDVDFVVLGVPKTVGSVLKQSFLTTLSNVRIIYLSLFDLVTGRTPVSQLSGPVGIVNQIGKAASIGWRPVVNILAIISINLGVVNMLPLPALDGGKTLLLIVEGIRRKPLNRNVETAINLVGFGLLILLMIFVSISDIGKLL